MVLLSQKEAGGDCRPEGSEKSDHPPKKTTGARTDILLGSWLMGILWLVGTIGAATMAAIFAGKTASVFIMALSSFLPLLVLIRAPLAGLVIYLTIVIWQNTAISFWSEHITLELLSVLKGLNFFVTLLCGIFCFFSLIGPYRRFSSALAKKAINAAFLLVLLCVLYTGFGTVANGFPGAMAYFRTFSWGLFCLAIGVYISHSCDFKAVLKVFIFISTIAIGFGLFEFFFPQAYYSIIKLNYFLALKRQSGPMTVQQVVDYLTRLFFNSPYFKDLGLKSFRIVGPNLHNISFGYLLSFAAISFFACARYLGVFAAFFLLFIVGAKGPTLLAFFSIGFSVLYRIGYPSSLRNKTTVALCLFLIGLLIVAGLSIRDFHVLGLIGGVNSFLSNPFGHGLGYGGNLAEQKGAIDWQEIQNTGAAPYGVESSVGVLLSQWGVVGLFYMGYLVWIWKHLLLAYKNGLLTKNSQADFSSLPIAMGITIVNLFFQEEALSPTAIGLILLWVGLVLNSIETEQVSRKKQ